MDITLERILSLIPSEKDGRFKKYAAAEFAAKIGIAPNLPSEWKAGRNKSYKTKLQTAEKQIPCMGRVSGAGGD